MSGSAKRTKRAVSAAQTRRSGRPAGGDAERLLARTLLQQIGEDPARRRPGARVGETGRARGSAPGGDREGRITPVDAEVPPQPPPLAPAQHARESGRKREEGGVAARWRACPGRSGEPFRGPRRVVPTRYTGLAAPNDSTRRGRIWPNPFTDKRIHRAERERLENRNSTRRSRPVSAARVAAAEGDSAKVDEEYRSLISRIDKAVKTGALHRNNGARKKSRASRIRSQSS